MAKGIASDPGAEGRASPAGDKIYVIHPYFYSISTYYVVMTFEFIIPQPRDTSLHHVTLFWIWLSSSMATSRQGSPEYLRPGGFGLTSSEILKLKGLRASRGP